MLVVSDTSPMLALLRLEQLTLLQKLFQEVVIPPTVYSELVNAHITDGERTTLLAAKWIRLEAPSGLQDFTLVEELDAGEAEAIALALEKHAELVLIDESMGRLVAKQHGLRIMGLIGILEAAKKEGLVPLIKPLLDKLRNGTGFWIADKLYNNTLRRVGEL